MSIIIGVKRIPVLLLALIGFGCREHPAKEESGKRNTPKELEIVVAAENFDIFFENFNNDSVFQLSRIQFPLKLKSNEGEDSFIKKGEWRYTKLVENNRAKTIIRKEVIGNSEIRIDYMVEDTGVLVSHTFHLIDKQWILTNIEDHST